jgi:hypothetical protein
MGDIADMMLDGDMCEGCGEYLGGGDGFPRRCYGCGDLTTADRLWFTADDAARGGTVGAALDLGRDHPHVLAARCLAGEALRAAEARIMANCIFNTLKPERREALRAAFPKLPKAASNGSQP